MNYRRTRFKDENQALFWLSMIFFSLVWIFALFKTQTIYGNEDFPHTLLAGKDIVTAGGFPIYNAHSIIDGMKIIYQQWLYSVVLYEIYACGGWLGLYLFFIVELALVNIAVISLCRVRGLSMSVSLLVTSLFMILIGLVPSLYSLRPWFITVFLVLMELVCVEHFLRTNRWYWLVGIIVTFVVETNVRMALWIGHLAMLLPYIVPLPSKVSKFLKCDDVSRWITKKQRVVLCMTALAGVVSTLLNPYGLDGSLFLMKASGALSVFNVNELNGLASETFVYKVMVVSLASVWVLLITKRRFDAVTLFMLCGTTIMALNASRNVLFLDIGLLYFMITCLADQRNGHLFKRAELHTENVPMKLIKTTVAFCVMSFIVFGVWFGSSSPSTPDMVNLYGNLPDSILQQQSNVIKENMLMADQIDIMLEECEDAPRVFSLNFSAYLEWKGCKVAADNRWELWSEKLNEKEDLLNSMHDVWASDALDTTWEKLDEQVSSGQFDYAVADNAFLWAYFEHSSDWEVMYKDKYIYIVRHIGEGGIQNG